MARTEPKEMPYTMYSEEMESLFLLAYTNKENDEQDIHSRNTTVNLVL